MPALSVDGQDVLAAEAAARRAALAVRRGEGPCFVEFRTYRFRAHSMYDPQLYRGREEVESWRARDPITLFAESLSRAGLLGDAERQAMEREIELEIEKAACFADGAPVEPEEDLLKDVAAGEAG